MNNALKAALGGVLLAGTSAGAMAQDVIIAPEQETVIREYVKREPVASISLPGFELNLGSTVPQEAEVYTIREQPYSYTVIDDRTVIVEPETRKVVRILD